MKKDFSNYTVEELKSLKRSLRIIVIVVLAFVVMGWCLCSLVYDANEKLAMGGFLVGVVVCFCCTVIFCKKVQPIEVELRSRVQKEKDRTIHTIVPVDCKTSVSVSSSSIGIKKGIYYIWVDDDKLMFYPDKILDDPKAGLKSVLLDDVLYYEVIGEVYNTTRRTSQGHYRTIAHDDRKLRLNMACRQEIICNFQDYNMFKLVLPDKDSASL